MAGKKNWEDEYAPEIVEKVKNRDYVNGGADAVFMTDEDYAATLKEQSLYNDANDATRQALHESAERRRAGYNYSGGADGSQYNIVNQQSQQQPFTYESAPQYVAQNQAMIDALRDQILGRQPFEYDYESDPRWMAYKDQYEREGDRAMKNTLAQVSARTGGLASSYATNAAQGANDYYMQQLADKIPELYNLAYDMYLNEDNRDRQNLAMLQSMENDNYNRYRDALSQWNTDRNFGYGQYIDDRNFNYQTSRDAIADARYADELGYARERDALSDERYADETAYSRAMAAAQLAAQYGDYSLLEELGINPYSSVGGYGYSGGGYSGGSSGGGGYSGGNNVKNYTDLDDVDDATGLIVGTPAWYEVMYAQGYTSDAALRTWAKDNGYASGIQDSIAKGFTAWQSDAESGKVGVTAKVGTEEWYKQMYLDGYTTPDAIYSWAEDNKKDPEFYSGQFAGWLENNGDATRQEAETSGLLDQLSGYGITPASEREWQLARRDYNAGHSSSIGSYPTYSAYLSALLGAAGSGADSNLEVDMNSVLNLGIGTISEMELQSLVESGQVEEYEEGGKLKFRWRQSASRSPVSIPRR